MHHALIFSTSKHLSSDSDVASWLADFANFADAFAAITKRAIAGEIDSSKIMQSAQKDNAIGEGFDQALDMDTGLV